VHLNPVRAGIVARAEDYPWSSYRCYISDEPNDLVDFPDIYYQLSKRPERQRQMVKEVTESKPRRQKYLSLMERRPDLTERIFYGSPRFVERMEKQYTALLDHLIQHRRAARPTRPSKKPRSD
jgi:putative transposase